MQAMQKLARGGRTVVASIHQPRAAILDLLDRLVLISEGRTVYLGEATDARAFFAAQGFVCPPRFNQSDFYLDTISMVRVWIGDAMISRRLGKAVLLVDRSIDALGFGHAYYISSHCHRTTAPRSSRPPRARASRRSRMPGPRRRRGWTPSRTRRAARRCLR